MSKKMSGPGNPEYGVKGETGEKIPAKVKSADRSGEKSERMVTGVALGKMDELKGREKSHLGKKDGQIGEHNGGRMDSEVYSHEREEYRDGGKHRTEW